MSPPRVKVDSALAYMGDLTGDPLLTLELADAVYHEARGRWGEPRPNVIANLTEHIAVRLFVAYPQDDPEHVIERAEAFAKALERKLR